MQKTSRQTGLRLGLVLLGLFGAAFAIAGVFASLPGPAAGGTCGPGKLSESAIVAFFDPVSIGAGREPAATTTETAISRAQWMAFVGECQASADSRVLSTFAILVLSVVVALGGIGLSRRATRRPAATTAAVTEQRASL
jgi:hypothetical protein